MNARHPHRHSRIPALAAAATGLLVAALALPPAARAHGIFRHAAPHHVYRAPHHVYHRGFSRYPTHAYAFRAPRYIGVGAVALYRPYYVGRLYEPRHHHHHTVYRFPVYGYGGAVTYRPYAYCNGGFYARGYYGAGGLRFDLSLGF